MATKTEGRHTGEFLISENLGHISRDEATVTVAATTTLAAGMVLGRLATGKYVPYDDAGSDGSEVAYGILYEAAVNEAGAPADIQKAVINQDAEVRATSLEWAAGVNDASKLAAYEDLRSRGIKVRLP
jgi:hypothetical protein